MPSKKQFSLDKTPDKTPSKASLNILSKKEAAPIDMDEINLQIRDALFQLAKETWGDVWKYSLIKAVNKHTGINLKWTQFSLLEKNKTTLSQKNMFAILTTIASLKSGVTIKVSNQNVEFKI